MSSGSTRAWRGLRTLAQVGPFSALLVLVLLLPAGVFATYSLRPSDVLGVGTGFTFEQYADIVGNQADRTILLRTLALGLGVALIVTALAFVVAYALTFRFRRRAALAILGVILAASISSLLVRVYAWATILGNNGIVNSALQGLGISDEPLSFLFFGYFGIAVTMVYVYLPIGTLILYSAFQNVDARSLEASHDLGAGRWRTLARVVGPQVATGLLASLGFVAILACGDYVTPSLVGGVRGQTIGTVIRDAVLVQGDYAQAAALGLTFAATMGAALLVLTLGWRASRPLHRGAGRWVDRVTSRQGSPAHVSWRWSLSRPLTIVLVAYVVLPTMLVIAFSFNDRKTAGLPWRAFTTDWYPYIVERAGFANAATTSLGIAATAVVLSLAVGTPVALALTRLRRLPARILWLAVLLPFVVPGVLWGSSLIIAATDQAVPLGPEVTSLVHVLLAIPLVVIVVYTRLTGMDRSIFEAARDLGAPPLRVWRTVTIPIMLPSLIGASLFAAAYSLDELFVTNFTIGQSNTIPVWVLGQIRYGFNPGINALGVMLLAVTLLVLAASLLVLRQTLLADDGLVHTQKEST